MKVAVYPHTLELGGSQMNALDLASAVRRQGVEVVVFAQPGELLGRVEDLGLPFVEAPPPSHRPTPRVMRALIRLVTGHGVEVVHGYEWTTIMEAYWGPKARLGTPVVGTVMSMSVAPFVPHDIPLVVGTRQIAAHEEARGRRGVHVIEPPVDVESDVRQDADAARFRSEHGLAADDFVVVVVCRLVPELKLEGVLAAVELAGDPDLAMRLVIVGDGPASALVSARAAETNARAGRDVVVLTGALGDPRPAYAAADVCLGMGGSALRAMAFGRPLVVQGERGFWELLTPETADRFRWTGWYGIGPGRHEGAGRLRSVLARLRHDRPLRASLGAASRSMAEQEFPLQQAAARQLQIYTQAVAVAGRPRMPDAARSAAGLARYHLDRQSRRLTRRRAARDDFNARPVAATDRPGPTTHRSLEPAEGDVP